MYTHVPLLPAPYFLPRSLAPSIPSSVSLLEYEEEELHCKTVYLFFEQLSVSSEQWWKILQLLGFQLVPPSNLVSLFVGPQYHFMAYQLEDGDDSD